MRYWYNTFFPLRSMIRKRSVFLFFSGFSHNQWLHCIPNSGAKHHHAESSLEVSWSLSLFFSAPIGLSLAMAAGVCTTKPRPIMWLFDGMIFCSGGLRWEIYNYNLKMYRSTYICKGGLVKKSCLNTCVYEYWYLPLCYRYGVQTNHKLNTNREWEMMWHCPTDH